MELDEVGIDSVQVFFQLFAQGGDKMRLYGLLGGASMYPCGKRVGNLGVWGHAPPGNFDFGPFIGRNLMESGTVFAQTQFTIYCVIKPFIIDLHVK